MSLDDFKSLVTRVESTPGYQRPAAFALGLANYAICERRPDQGTRSTVTLLPVGLAVKTIEVADRNDLVFCRNRQNVTIKAQLTKGGGRQCGNSTPCSNA